jgi:hypothetical protein
LELASSWVDAPRLISATVLEGSGPLKARRVFQAPAEGFRGFLDGTQRGKTMVQAFLRRNRVTVAFGPAIEFDRTDTSREGLEAATERIKAAVERLRGK